MVPSEYDNRRNRKVSCQRKVMFIFRKIEGYIPSSLGARSIPVDRLQLAGWKISCFSKSFKAGQVSSVLIV